jgi:sterol desaturase/sphingolipid hydroxylase (fatty acid hydroxylase superfamily)
MEVDSIGIRSKRRCFVCITEAFIIKALVIVLTAALYVALTATVLDGRRLHGLSPLRPLRLLRSHAWLARRTGILMIVLVVTIEAIVIPYFGRHYDTLFFVQLGFSIIFAVALVASHFLNGTRSSHIHRYLGWTTFIAGSFSSFLGIIVVILLHRS